MPIGIFNDDEFYVLKKIWKDLSERTDDDGIDKATFLNYIPISGLLGERLFFKFDARKTEFISFDDFVNNLSVLYLGTTKEQVKFLFDVCNINNDGLIPKQDLIMILNCIPKNIFCHYCNNKTKPKDSDAENIVCTENTSDTNIINIPHNGSSNKINFIEYTNSCVCDGAFVHYKDLLDYDDFSAWIKNTPAILGYIKSVIPCVTENIIQDEDKPAFWKKGEKTGFILKRYYLLYESCLYYYYHKTDSRPRGIIFLTGSIIRKIKDEEMEEKGYYGFEICQQNLCTGEHHHHEKRSFYFQSLNDCDDLLHRLHQLSNATPFDEEYTIGRRIGTGAFSEVYACVHKITNKPYAVKIINKKIFEKVDKDLLRNEIAILKLISHPNVINLKYTSESNEEIFIVTELIEDGDFFNFISNKPCFKEDQLKKIIRQLLEGIAYLHEFGIVHCDIKPENILYDKTTGNIVKLTDFGLSRMVFSNENITDVCGTISYVAPEILTQQGHRMESDLWSVGIIMYLLSHGRLPFDKEDDNDTIVSIIQDEPNYKTATLSNNVIDLLKKLLDKSPSNRITAKEALLHPFLEKEKKGI